MMTQSAKTQTADLGLYGLLGVISRTNNIDPDLQACYDKTDQALGYLQSDPSYKRVNMVFE